LIVEQFGVHRSSAFRSVKTFEKHLLLVQGRPLARTGRSRNIMISRDLWAIFARSYAAFTEGKFKTFELALAEQLSGEFPEPRSLDDVYALLLKEREASVETMRRHEHTVTEMTTQHEMMVALAQDQQAQMQAEVTAVQGQVAEVRTELASVKSQLAEVLGGQEAMQKELSTLLEGVRLLGRILTHEDDG
jgi:septation ring formation regulator EzrA